MNTGRTFKSLEEYEKYKEFEEFKTATREYIKQMIENGIYTMETLPDSAIKIYLLDDFTDLYKTFNKTYKPK